MAYDAQSGRIILFGGVSGAGGYIGDTWAYDLEANVWTSLSPSSGPTPRQNHVMAYDTQSDRIVLFGGDDTTGPVGDTCGAPSPDCDDRNPFTVEACASAAGCTYTTLTGIAAADAGLGALKTTIAASAVEALGTRRTSERLGNLVAGAIAKLGLNNASSPVTALGGREARKRVKRAGRRVTRLVRVVERGVRKRKIQRDIGLDLLDLGRATQAALGELKRKQPAKATSLSARPLPPFAPAGR